ncbi:hypothetical protein BLA60_31285 [Actinophytocola xinjiangensis]|uniref:DUF5302 domain-containing protein n=1 Tax=Actinophytocola xinjiangensis TaxID=485602 RepID=A0A7Z0WGQ1_9PSEU|nr:DUF5302 domain-containing protein [Actinophytocola xinjiangensis]OLF06458.1 hypothetical protein BLA60_31285 [Actinophytocola xinjiangensis]
MPDTPEPAIEDDNEPEADVKQRFREALERKQALTRSGEEHADARSKVRDAHGPVSAKRTFRRKSG